MSPLVFHTASDQPYDVEIANVGVVGGSNRGGILVERAAKVLRELQDETGEPLKGSKLESAAEAFAESRGFRVKSLKNIDEEKLRVEAGAFPAGPTIEEIASAAAERDRAQVQAHAEDPEAPPLTQADLPVQETAVVPPMPGQEG